MAGGRTPEEVNDLATRVGHASFDLVIMNPPFVRPTGNEGTKLGSGNSAFAAFKTDKMTQRRMQKSLVKLRGKEHIGNGNAGLASDFVDLALRKARLNGTIAVVLPLSAILGSEWETARRALGRRFGDITVVTISASGHAAASFSENTSIAECLLSARKSKGGPSSRATFVTLRSRVASAVQGDLLAAEILRKKARGNVRRLEDGNGFTELYLGNEDYGSIVDAPLPDEGPWCIAGISDGEVAQAAYNLTMGELVQLGRPGRPPISLPIVAIREIANRGPYHADIYWSNSDGTPRGPFELIKPAVNEAPTYPMLWSHNNRLERRLVVEHDSEGKIKVSEDGSIPRDLLIKADEITMTVSRVHYNRDVTISSQSLMVATTERPSIGGRAWPSVSLHERNHEAPFALWSKSTLGFLMHWWRSNRTQPGRATTSVTAMPNIPTLDTRTLTLEQLGVAQRAFDEMRDRLFLPFDQMDEDPSRAELDRRLIVDVLGLSESLCEDGGPIDLMRRKLAREPSVHGGKKTRVVFYGALSLAGNQMVGERSERRDDR